MPGYDAVLKGIKELGFPIVVASLLLWIILSGLPEDIRRAVEQTAQARQELTEHRHESGQLLRVVIQLCVNTAPDASARERCIP